MNDIYIFLIWMITEVDPMNDPKDKDKKLSWSCGNDWYENEE